MHSRLSPFSSVQFSCSVVSDSLQPHESQHTRPPCPSPLPGVYSNSRPSSRWCHPANSSSVVPFSSCPQSLPASESFPTSQLFAWGGQSTGVSALASFLPKNTLTLVQTAILPSYILFSLILFLLFFLPELSFHSSHSFPLLPSHKLSLNVSGSMKLPWLPQAASGLFCVFLPLAPTPATPTTGHGLHAQLSISFTVWNIQLLISTQYSPLSTDF